MIFLIHSVLSHNRRQLHLARPSPCPIPALLGPCHAGALQVEYPYRNHPCRRWLLVRVDIRCPAAAPSSPCRGSLLLRFLVPLLPQQARRKADGLQLSPESPGRIITWYYRRSCLSSSICPSIRISGFRPPNNSAYLFC